MDPQFSYRVHSQNSRTGEDDGLRFLSREEQECLQFFEQTIDSLEESLEEDGQQPEEAKPTVRSRGVQEVDGHLSLTPSPSTMLSTLQSRFHGSKDHDIIDLVHPQPTLMQSRAVDFNPTSPDFHNMVPTPGSHLEMKPTDSSPSESNVGSTDSQGFQYHPPGCIPTPVLIAQKIAENQPGGTSNSQLSPLHCRCSEEYEKPSSPSADLLGKQGPPTSAKPAQYPANISVNLGSREHQSHSFSNVSLQERRAQMLANLTGSHPLLQEEANYAAEEKAGSSPRRSISFRDPTPDKSRMEALSKLGLTRNRAMSGGLSLLASTKSPSPDTDGGALKINAPESSLAAPQVIVTTSNQNQASVERNSEIPRRHSLRRDSMSNLLPPTVPETNYQPSAVPQTNYQPSVPQTNYQPAVPQTNYQPAVPQTNYQPAAVPQTNYQPAVPQTNYHPPPLETVASVPPHPEVTSPEFNSYGGKSILVKPTSSPRTEAPGSPTSPEPKVLPPATEFNTYGGKSKTITPAPAAVKRNDLPDILSSHMNRTQSFPGRSDPVPPESSRHRERGHSPSHPPGVPTKSVKAPAPTPAPRPPRNSYHGPVSTQKPPQRPLSPQFRRKPASMFPSHGITVQFSGRGATEESRKDALRKLGLLKDS